MVVLPPFTRINFLEKKNLGIGEPLGPWNPPSINCSDEVERPNITIDDDDDEFDQNPSEQR